MTEFNILVEFNSRELSLLLAVLKDYRDNYLITISQEEKSETIDTEVNSLIDTIIESMGLK